MADYTAGILAIDQATRTVSRVPLPADAPAYGIDGLIYHRGTLIALQNGVSPQRVVRLFLGPAEPAVVVAELLLLNDPSLLEPTLGVMVGDDFHYVATSQGANFDDSGALRPAGERRPAVIARMRLSP